MMHLGGFVGNAGVLCCDRIIDQTAQDSLYLQYAIGPAFVSLAFQTSSLSCGIASKISELLVRSLSQGCAGCWRLEGSSKSVSI